MSASEVITGATLCLLLTSPSVQTPPETFDFLWRPQSGLVTQYRISMNVDLPGTQMSLTGDLVQTVGSRDKSGSYNVSTAMKNVKVLTDADTQTLDNEPFTTQRYDAHGRRIDSEDDAANPFGDEVGRSTDFLPPQSAVKMGQKWSAPVKAAGHSPAGRLDYRLLDAVVRDKVRLLHIRFAYTEPTAKTPVQAGGFFFVDSRDNSIVESEATLHNVHVSPDLPRTTVELRMSRTARHIEAHRKEK